VVAPSPHPLAHRPAPVRIGAFALLLALVWWVIHLILTHLWGQANFVAPATMVGAYAVFFGLLQVWGRQLYQQPQPLQFYGWSFRGKGWRELLLGLGLGGTTLMLLFAFQSLLGWARWQPVTAAIVPTIWQGLLLGVAVGCAEELLFRGWLLQELHQDYSARVALSANSFIFALLHFLRPLEAILQTWTQGLGLVILGMLLVWARRLCRGRLGLAIGLHGGLVWGYYVVDQGDLIHYSRQVPAWVTGINDNPLAGVVGLVFITLLATAVGLCWRQHHRASLAGQA
jgi:uncharacterized protein